MKKTAIILICFLGFGCGQFVPVEGIVTMDGQPFPEATVVFAPVEKSPEKGHPREATAFTDKEGRFSLKTSRYPGVIPGKYKVLVSKRIPPKGLENPKNVGEAVQATHRSVESVPKRYTNEKSTPLEIDVPRGGRRNLELSVEKQ